MATAAVDIPIQIKGLNQLLKLEQKMKAIELQFKKTTSIVPQLGRSIAKGFGNAASAAQKAAGKIKRAIGSAGKAVKNFSKQVNSLQGIFGGLALGAGLSGAFNAAAEAETTQRRVKGLISTYSQFAGIQDVARASAERFQISNTEALKSYVDLGNRLGAQGRTLGELQAVYEGLNVLLLKNGASAQEAASVQLQLNQALGAGVLQGDEFRSIAEGAPQLLDALAEQLGVTRGEVKQLGSDGKLTGDVIVDALAGIRDSGLDDVDKLLAGAAGSQRQLSKAFQEFQVIVGNELLPLITPLIKALTTALQLFGRLPGPVKAVTVATVALGAALLIVAPAIAALSAGAVILAAKAAAVVAGLAAIGLALKTAYDNSETFRNAINQLGANAKKSIETAVRVFLLAKELVVKAYGEIKSFFEKTTDEMGDKWKDFTDFLGKIWESITGFIGDVWGQTVEFLNKVLGLFGTSFAEVVNGIGDIWNKIVDFMASKWQSFVKFAINAALTLAGPLQSIAKALGVDIADVAASGLAGLGNLSLPQFSLGSIDFQLPSFELPDRKGGSTGTDGSGSGSGSGSGASDAKQLADQLERARQQEQEAIKNQDQIVERLKLQVAIAEEKSELKKLEKQYLLDILELEQEIKNRSVGASAERIAKLNEEYDLRRKIIDTQFDDNFFNAGFAMGEGLAADIDRVNSGLTDTEQLLNNSFNIVTNGLQSGIQGLIDGTKDWNDVLSDILGQLGNMLLQFGFSSLGAGLGIPGFAEGGILPTNGPAIVGEEGPELVMNRGGQSRVFSNQETTAALQRYSPGNRNPFEGSGNRASDGTSRRAADTAPITLNVTATRIADDNWVKVDDLKVALAQTEARAAQNGAKMGEARTLRKLQMSPGSRRKVGM